ncbi:MAG: ammonium transporter [Thaumarchaeota archaeon]|nr:ammonium transporter [Nitrososphaerota archaeon]
MSFDVGNNLFVLIAGLLVFVMTPAVGMLEVGELGEEYSHTSMLKVMLIAGIGLVVMAVIGFNTSFAPTLGGVIGNPFYSPGFLLGGFSPNATGLLTGTFWSMTPAYYGSNLSTGSYFLFEVAFAMVTLALVGVVILRNVKLEAFAIFSVVYFVVIWNLPAAWIWNPTGWLYNLGMRDFAGGLVVHGAAGAAGLGILVQAWIEERKAGLKRSPSIPISVSPNWLTLSILLLWIGWFGFNPGSVLAFNSSATTVVLTTFLAAASSFVSLMLVVYWKTRQNPGLINMANGILIGLIVITPVAGFVSPASSIILGLIGGPLFFAAEVWFGRRKWFADPVGLLPGHLTGGIFGVLMIGFFAQNAFAAASGNSTVPNGLLFGGGIAALHQLGIEVLGIAVVLVVVFSISFVTIRIASQLLHGILTQPEVKKVNLTKSEAC